MQIVRSGVGDDNDYEPRFSNSSSLCVFGPLICLDSPRKSLSYNKLPHEPLRLTIRKLDGSSFGIAVAKSGKVGELKRAVQAAFRHLPNKGSGSISWEHVWGQFCLCYEGHKLLSDSDYIGLYGIKDGDQLQFVRHMSNKYDLVRTEESERGEEHLVDEPSISDGSRDDLQNSEENDNNQIELLEDDVHGGMESDFSNDENRSPSSGGVFSYHKLSSSQMKIEHRSTSRDSNRLLGSFKNIFCFHSNKYDLQKES